MSSVQLLEEMRQDLLVAADHLDAEEDRHRAGVAARGRRLAAGTVVLLIGLAGAAVATVDTASAGLEVLRQGDELLVRVHDVESRPDEIESAAQEAGLDVTVVEVPVGPSNVGRFVGATAGRLPGVLTVDDSDPSSPPTGFRIPVGFDAPITLELGRPAADGEEWTVPSSATAAGEALACADLVGGPLADTLDLVRTSGLPAPRVLRADTGALVDPGARPSGRLTVVRVESFADETLVVHVVEELDSIPALSPTAAQGCD